jgi:diguanylate cyclase (GGDEF)-like protein/PAS domain S-box-containing protein
VAEPDEIAVLLIEDDEDDVLLTKALLNEAQQRYRVRWERSPESGLAALLSGSVDVCLLDQRLGLVTGLELLGEARAVGVRTPIILLTGEGDRDTDLQAMRRGASDYLVRGRLDAPLLERSIRYAIERAAHVAALADSEEQFRSLLESASDGIVIADADGRVVHWNPSAAQLFRRTDLGDRTLEQLLDDPARAATAVDELRLVRRDRLELEGIRGDGTRFPAEIALSSWDSTGGVMWSAIIRDVTDRRALESQLEHQAFHDPLTGLANRTLLRNRLEHALRRRMRTGGSVAVLFVDLDDFKRINDTLGHAAGDDLLLEVTARVTRLLRPTDTAARLGGDEFAVVLEDVRDVGDATRVARRLLESLDAPVDVAGARVTVSASIGIAAAMSANDDADTLLRYADVAMYAAKEGGKSRFAQFEHEMHARLVRRLQLEGELRAAIVGREGVAYYQPIVDLRTGRILGVEALMRWLHPDRGLLAPGDFIPVAEETGLIAALGRQLRAEAFRQVREWRRLHPGLEELCLAVNVSPRELDGDGFVAELVAALDVARLPRDAAVIEITEGATLRNRGVSARRLTELRAAGVRIAIDDFGTGYSSLSYVQQLPAQILKIDRSFVADLRAGGDTTVLSAIVAMSHGMGLVTIAEGIEDQACLELIAGLGCDYGQGYHFARPADARTITGLLLANADETAPRGRAIV